MQALRSLPTPWSRHTVNFLSRSCDWIEVGDNAFLSLHAVSELINLHARVYALYNRNKVIAVLLATYLTAELGVALWLYLTPSLSRKS